MNTTRGRIGRALSVAAYLGADVLRSQRFLLPLIVFGAVLAVLFGGDPGAPPAPWAASVLAIYPTAAWFGLIVANTEDPVQRTVTMASAGGPGAVAAGSLLVALVGDVVLAAMAVVWPVVTTHYSYPPPLLLHGALAHLAAAATGTAVGLLCARPLVRRIGWSFCIAVTVVVITAVQPLLPPVGAAARTLTVAEGQLPVLDVGLGLALACAAAAVIWRVDLRR
ncbi:hypothetical protein [Pseudonocardia sp. GCM10023141]|uniref:hypothetical protein n=1 Tax=Pseudonocardia sp. GCM10023141 TaxID=3252653 RepID=UPI003621D946